MSDTTVIHPTFHHAADHAEGMSFPEIHAKAMSGGYASEQAPVEIPEMKS